MRRIVLDEIVDGSAKSAGELIDKLQKASPEQRRKMLDGARERAGLKTATKIELEKQMEEAGRQSVAMRDHRLVLTPHGYVDADDQQAEANRTAARLESRRAQREADQAARAVEAEATRASNQARDEAFRREIPPGFPL